MLGKKLILFAAIVVVFASASVSFGDVLPLTYAYTDDYHLPVVLNYIYGNFGSVDGGVNLGGHPDGKYMRIIGGNSNLTGSGSFTMAFDFFAQGQIDPSWTGIPLIVYAGNASDGVSVTIYQADFFSSASTNNQASISLFDNLSFLKSPNGGSVKNKLSADGNYAFDQAGNGYFQPGWGYYTTQSNFNFTDIVGIKFTFVVTGFTEGKFFEFDAVSTTYDPVPVPTPPGTPVPEPTTMLLLGSGLIGLVGFGRRKFRKS